MNGSTRALQYRNVGERGAGNSPGCRARCSEPGCRKLGRSILRNAYTGRADQMTNFEFCLVHVPREG